MPGHATVLTCPHCSLPSVDGDFCSECGKSMRALSARTPQAGTEAPAPASRGKAPLPSAVLPQAMSGTCPDCGSSLGGRVMRFCECCRYDLVACESWSPEALAETPRHLWLADEGAQADWYLVPVSPVVGRYPQLLIDRRVYVGRGSQASGDAVLFNDTLVSRKHGYFDFDKAAALVFVDTGSSNGTFLEGQRLAAHQPIPIPDGATLQFGAHATVRLRKATR